jgi:hypothetical protein
VTRRRPTTSRSTNWNPETARLMERAAFHGFADDSTPENWDPPSGWFEQPTRAWCAEVYEQNRARLLYRFTTNPTAFLSAWPVAVFEPNHELRTAAVRAVDESRQRWREVRLSVFANEPRRT